MAKPVKPLRTLRRDLDRYVERMSAWIGLAEGDRRLIPFIEAAFREADQRFAMWQGGMERRKEKSHAD